MQTSDSVGRFFDRNAERFGSLYARPRGFVDRFFRQGKIQRRFQQTLGILGDVKGCTVLDVGAGSGVYSIQLAGQGAQVTGLDVAPEMVALARRNAEQAGRSVDFTVGDFLIEPLAGPYDVLLFIGVFDYVPAPQVADYFRKAAALTARRFIATFPKRLTLESVVRTFWLGRQGRAVYFYSRRQIEALAARFNLQVRFHDCNTIWIVEFVCPGFEKL
jgi:SAM-dependent methyltransferase